MRLSQAANVSDPEHWLLLAQSALSATTPIPRDELLLVRDLEGRSFRPIAPPDGVTARLGAVLVLLYPDGPDLRLPLTVRSETLSSHRGEVSLPGGATEPSDADPAMTALREANEELGIEPRAVALWGALSPIYISASNFHITPIVGYSADVPILTVNSGEVSAVITTTLRELLDPALVITERWTLRGMQVDVPFFAISGYKVWGATALILSEFVARMRAVIHQR